MKANVIAICDENESYCFMLDKYIREHVKLSLEIFDFTNLDDVKKFKFKDNTSLIIISQSLYEELEDLEYRKILVLDEGELRTKEYESENIKTISKYQVVDSIVKEILGICMEDDGLMVGNLPDSKMGIIGLFTPIGRSLQTTFALSLGQELSVNKKVLYLNLEFAAAFEFIMDEHFDENLADLLYFYECHGDKVGLYIDRIKRNVGGLDYIPPVLSGEQICSTTIEQWMGFFKEITRSTDYDYLILDITENVANVYDMLDICDRIYTIQGRDSLSKAKMDQYDLCLQKNGKDNIISKSRKISIPLFKNLITKASRLPSSEISVFVRNIIREDDFYGNRT